MSSLFHYIRLANEQSSEKRHLKVSNCQGSCWDRFVSAWCQHGRIIHSRQNDFKRRFTEEQWAEEHHLKFVGLSSAGNCVRVLNCVRVKIDFERRFTEERWAEKRRLKLVGLRSAGNCVRDDRLRSGKLRIWTGDSIRSGRLRSTT